LKTNSIFHNKNCSTKVYNIRLPCTAELSGTIVRVAVSCQVEVIVNVGE
jgi:hypothetical protein